jgi:hypothetical protein
MKSDKNQNSDVDLSKFFEKEKVSSLRSPIIQPVDMKIDGGRRSGGLVWVVIVNFIIGAAIFSYYIVKANNAGAVKPVSMQKISAPINYTPGQAGQYMLPLP